MIQLGLRLCQSRYFSLSWGRIAVIEQSTGEASLGIVFILLNMHLLRKINSTK